MPRVRSKVARHKHRKRVMKEAKGYVGGRSKLYRTAKEAVMRAKAFATAHRKDRKGDFRRLWITRISAACQQRADSLIALDPAGEVVSAAEHRRLS